MKMIKIYIFIFVLLGGNQICYAKNHSGVKIQKNKVWDVKTKQSVKRARSRLVRYKDGVCITTKTRDLTEGAYTVWWVLYNEPDHCANPVPYGKARCGDSDLFNPNVRASVMLASGKIVGPNGKMFLNACIKKGELTTGLFDMGTQEGLTNPAGAEIQMIIRHHGEAHYDDPTLLGSQLSNYLGNCEVNGGQATCEDKQQIIHQSRRSR